MVTNYNPDPTLTICRIWEFIVHLYNISKLCHESCYSFSSIHCLAFAVVNLMARYTAPHTMTLSFLEEPLCNLPTGRLVGYHQWSQFLDFVHRDFQKPQGSLCSVFMLVLYPVLDIQTWSLHLKLILLPMPLNFFQLGLTLTEVVDCYQLNVLYLFLAILGFMWGLRVPVRPVRRCCYFWRLCWATERGTRIAGVGGPNCSKKTKKDNSITETEFT